MSILPTDWKLKLARAVLPQSLEEKLGITSKPMEFRVGEGLTPEQTTKAYKTLSKPSGLPEKQSSYEESVNIYGNLSARKYRGEKLNASDEETLKQSARQMMDIAVGFMNVEGNIAKAGIKKIVPVKGVSESFAIPIKTGETSVQKVINALKESKPLRGIQETLYTAGRAEKLAKSLAVGKSTTGEAGFYSELGQLKGELPRVQFETVRNKVGQIEIDDLFNQVKNSPLLGEWDKISARGGLVKLFGESGGKVPTNNEIALLDKVFPEEFTQTLLNKRPFIDKLKEAGYQLANIPRSVMASFDLSAPLRQGVFLVGKPKQFGPALIDMFRSAGSEKTFQVLQESIATKPNFKLMQESGLSLADMGTTLIGREERFMSNWAEKIPIVGRIIRASGRAYTGFLNKLRADVFDDLVGKATNLGLKPETNKGLTREIANFVNNATGRGNLGSLQKSATALNSFFFSPRLMASRLTLLNPLYYIKANPFVRKEALKSLFSYAGTVATILSLAKLGGAEVGTDWRSSDFAKIKIGNTRIDIMGGFQQYLRMIGQLATGEYVSSTTGKVMTLGEGYKPLTRLDILGRQIEAKEAPIFSFITNLLRGQDYAGQPINIKNEVAQRFIPMAVGDLVDLYKDNPDLMPVGLLGLFGVGVQTYSPKKETPKLTPLNKGLGGGLNKIKSPSDWKLGK